MKNPVTQRTHSTAHSRAIAYPAANLGAVFAALLILGLVLAAGKARAQDQAGAETDAKPEQSATGQGLVLPFPDLSDMQGNPADFKKAFDNGQWTLVKIWQANCHVCGEQAPLISQADSERDDFNVVGITVDGQRGIKGANRFIERHKPGYENFVGELAVVALNFQLLTEESFRGTPSYLLFGPDNKLMAAQAGMISKDALFEFIDGNS